MAMGIVLRENGGPEKLRLESIEVGTPGPDEVRLRQTAIGVNFHDIYIRTGLYKTLQLPGIPGLDAVGVVGHRHAHATPKTRRPGRIYHCGVRCIRKRAAHRGGSIVAPSR